MTNATPATPRLDLAAIVSLIPFGVRVLDLGCGDGELMARLVTHKGVSARGVEINEANVRACVGRGLTVRQGNIEEGLADYRDSAFDYVILSQTIQFLNHPEPVVREMLRVGKRAVISFDNASYWRRRVRALTGAGFGTTLSSGEPRVRAITLAQFDEFARSFGARIEQSLLVNRAGNVETLGALRAREAVYVLAPKSTL